MENQDIQEMQSFLEAQGWSIFAEEARDDQNKLLYRVTAIKNGHSFTIENENFRKALRSVKYKVLTRYIDICYLCGKKLDDETTKDHIPPEQFYPNVIKKQLYDSLTLPTHRSCNESYQKDEDHFVVALGFLASESEAGGLLFDELYRKSRKNPRYMNLFHKVYSESVRMRGNLVLPNGKWIHGFDGDRVWNVVWKITRGLFFKETGRYLPENTLKEFISINFDTEDQPKEFRVINGKSRGLHPPVFDYKYLEHPDIKNVHIWAMLFWNKLILVLKFNDPGNSDSTI